MVYVACLQMIKMTRGGLAGNSGRGGSVPNVAKCDNCYSWVVNMNRQGCEGLTVGKGWQGVISPDNRAPEKMA